MTGMVGPTWWDVDETTCVEPLASACGLSVADRNHISAQAKQLVTSVRDFKHSTGPVDSLLRQFGLSSEEGLALLSVAEAILRVPDPATANALIAGKLAGPAWSRHLSLHTDWFANTAAAALTLTSGLVKPAATDITETTFHKLLRRTGEPLVRQAVRQAVTILGAQFIYAKDIATAITTANTAPCSFDMLGEASYTADDAAAYLQAYTTPSVPSAWPQQPVVAGATVSQSSSVPCTHALRLCNTHGCMPSCSHSCWNWRKQQQMPTCN